VSSASVLHWTPTDYLSDYKTRRLDLNEHGAYMLLLWHMWNDSESQCEFPLSYVALASIWGVCPEEAERIADVLMASGVALVKVIERSSGTVLQSKRLREQRKAFLEMCEHKSDAGKASGRARQNKHSDLGERNEQKRTGVEHVLPSVQQVLNRNELTVVPYLGSPEGTKDPIDQNPSSYARGIREVRTYLEDKADRKMTAEETSFTKRAVPKFGADAVKLWLGYAIQEGADSICGYAMDGLVKGA
jgi:uncharacterized protein YdaU (DUF1376 family)